MKLAIISQESKSSKLLEEEAKKYFKEVSLINLKDLEVHGTPSHLKVLHKGIPFEHYDCVYCRGSHKHALLLQSLTEAFLINSYVPIKPNAFFLGHNKFLTLLELQKEKISIPTTYLAATIPSAKKILKDVNYPIIIKTPCGTHGKGVMFADSFASAASVLDALEVFKQPFIIQEYIETNSTDIRAIVAGNKVIAAMKRKAVSGEVRANIHMGAIGAPIFLDQKTEKTAIKAAQALGCDVCAVDILEDNVRPRVIEVNLSPGLQGITQATKINVAGKIAKFLYEKTQEFKEAKKKTGYTEIMKDVETKHEIMTNLDIKMGKIRLPPIVTHLCKLEEGSDIIIKVGKGKILIKKHDIK